jgi:predicted ATPase/DNA-binding winged helix-turn-helix (wHTH) protein
MHQVGFGPFRLDIADRRLRRGGTVIPLRPKTLAVLDYLVARPGRLVTKEQLLTAVWPDTAVSDTVLKVCVREIREALDDDPEQPRYLETAHRLGYRFIGQISRTNLPAPVSSLVGRERELEAVSRMLDRSRLVTLVGAGGSGKSRLALEVAGSMRERFDDGAWWVDLASYSAETFVTQAVAAALGVRDQPGEHPAEVLARFLAPRDLLLVVDNCEHLVEATAALVQRMLQNAPRLRILATSREPLKTDGEQVYVVPPLSIPEGGCVLTVSQAIEYEAVRLFDERARAAMKSFALSEESCPAVVEICRHLDGLPLAIELAAARVAAIAVEDIASRLHDSLRVLAPARRSALPRHQTLRTAIDWSYDLLSEAERRQLARLSVFIGPFTLEAAERIVTQAGGPDAEVFDLVSRLIDKSLVFVTDRPRSGRWRYRLLETVRQYAHEKFLSGAETAEVLGRYVDYYTELAGKLEPDINTSIRQARLTALELEHGNLREAIGRARAAGRHREAARLAGALFWFWFHRGHWREGRALLGAAIAHETAPTRIRARILLGDGVLAWAEGDHAAAAARLEEGAAIGRVSEDPCTAAHALHFLAMVRLAEGNAAAGRPLAEEAVRIARTAQDTFCLTIALASYGVLLLAQGHEDDAQAALQESVDRGRQSADGWAVALPLRNLAIVRCRRREYDAARRLLEESLRGLRSLGEKWFLSRSIETLAEVLAAAGDHERSAHLFGAAESLRESVGASVLAFYKAEYDRAVASARRSLGAESFERCWQLGRSLTPEEAVDYALGESDVEGGTEDQRRAALS